MASLAADRVHASGTTRIKHIKLKGPAHCDKRKLFESCNSHPCQNLPSCFVWLRAEKRARPRYGHTCGEPHKLLPPRSTSRGTKTPLLLGLSSLR